MLFAFVFSYILLLTMVAVYYYSIVRDVYSYTKLLYEDQNNRCDNVSGDIPDPPTKLFICAFQ